MSTKIYTAWRCPVARLNNTLLELRNAAFLEAAKCVKKYARTVPAADVNKEAEATAAARGSSVTGWLQRESRVRLAFDEAVRSSEAKDRSGLLEIDASLNVWLHGRHAYLIGYGDLWPYEYNPPGAEDFRYWNNSDGPDDLSRRKWDARRAAWDRAVLDHDWDATRMVHTVINAAENDFGLHEVCKLVLPRCDPYRVLR